ncbi:MAG: hypothetical protein AAGJ08_26910 [Cyanobacteria bacterium P01_H01_bin.35]
MLTESQARSLMVRHHHLVKNRQQSMLNRAISQVGLESSHYWGHIQGKVQPTFRKNYKRGSASMS